MTTAPALRYDVIAAARAIARDVARPAAVAVDAENRFPGEAIAALRESGLLGLLVPRSAGGMAGSVADSCKVAEVLGASCLSTGLIWAMHAQQVLVMADHALDQWHGPLTAIATQGALVASATTEPAKGGALMLAHAPLRPENETFRVDRASPVVSYGAEAKFHLVTMRGGPSSPETEVRYVLLERGDGSVTGGWDAMGMRGTRSVPMHYEANVRAEQVMAADFRRVAVMSAIPAAHLGWASAWYGCAHGALERFVALLRESSRQRRRLASDLFVTRLGDVRLSLDLLESMLRRLVARYDAMRDADVQLEAYDDVRWTIALNGLKVASSRLSHSVVDQLMTLAGLAQGYLHDSSLALERAYRDLRSAAMMISNDQLLQLNAKQLLLGGEQPPEEDSW